MPTCTNCQKSAWSGYCQAPSQVAPFSATHKKKPISTNDRLSGIAYRWSPTVKLTLLRHSVTTKPIATRTRTSGSQWWVKKFAYAAAARITAGTHGKRFTRRSKRRNAWQM